MKEWQGHNFLYDLHIFRSRTASVDLNEDEWQFFWDFVVFQEEHLK